MLASELSVPSATSQAALLYPPYATTSVTPNLYNPPVIRDPVMSRSLPSIPAVSASARSPSSSALSSPRLPSALSASAPLPPSTHSPWSFTNRQYPGGGSAYDRHFSSTTAAAAAAATTTSSPSGVRALPSSPRSPHPHAHAHAQQYLSPRGPASNLFSLSPTSPPRAVPTSTAITTAVSPSSAVSASPQSYGARGAADGPVQLSASARLHNAAAVSPRSAHMERSLVPPKYPGSSFLIDQSLPSVTGSRIEELPEYVSNGLVHRAAPVSSRSPRAAVTATDSNNVAGVPPATTMTTTRIATGFGLDGSCRRKQCFITRYQSHSIANRYRDRTQSAYA